MTLDTCHVAPNKWTLGTWKAKCHFHIMHELSGGKIGMRNILHGDCHMSSWIKKGVLHVDQKESVGGRRRKMRENIERRERKEKEKGRGNEIHHYWSLVFEQARVRLLKSKLECTQRGRGSLLLWLVFV